MSEPTSRQPMNPAGLLSLFAIYAIWSSTYLAIRVAVREGAGFPPFLMSGSRIFIAGCLLLLIGIVFRGRLRITREDLGVLAISAILLWVGGNGMVTWAEQRASSGYAALLVGSMPIWVAAMDAVLDRRPPSIALVAALIVGFAGVALLVGPVLTTGTPADVASVVALVAAPISWGAGSLLQKRRPVRVGTLASAAYQNLIGGGALLLLAMLASEPAPHPTVEAVAAWAYLIVFGTILAFTAYLQALKLLPIKVVATYAYVNPVGAVILGRVLLDEPITPLTVAGAALVLLGVAGVFREQLRFAAAATPEPTTGA